MEIFVLKVKFQVLKEKTRRRRKFWEFQVQNRLETSLKSLFPTVISVWKRIFFACGGLFNQSLISLLNNYMHRIDTLFWAPRQCVSRCPAIQDRPALTELSPEARRFLPSDHNISKIIIATKILIKSPKNSLKIVMPAAEKANHQC